MAAPAAAPMLASAPQRGEWRNCAGLAAIVLVGYLLLQNSYWASGPDTAFYISIARNLALARGFVFNGAPVANIPPGWPALLAGAMKISPAFAFINLVPMACLLGATVMWYWVLRRLVEPRRAFHATLLSAFLYPWYSASIQLRSEALFCLVFAGSILVALQIAEGKGRGWRVALLCLLCAAMVNVRFAGLVGMAVIAAVLLSGQRRLALSRPVVALALAGAVTAGAFFGTRYLLRDVLPAHAVRTKGPGGLDEEGTKEPGQVALLDRTAPTRYLGRALFAGQWVGSVLWMPLHIAVGSLPLAIAVNLLGWWLLFLYYTCAWKSARRGQFILLGAALYCGAIILRWPVVNPRYLMPVLPLIVIGIWEGCGHLRSAWTGGASALLLRWGTALFIASLVLCNAALFAVDAFIARSPRFYRLYNAGEVEQLLATARALQGLGARDGEAAVNGQIINLNRQRPNGFSMRGLVLLTDRTINLVPNQVGPAPKPRSSKPKPKATSPRNAASPSQAYTRGGTRAVAAKIGDGKPENPAVIEFCRAGEIRYYAYKPPGSVWHAWHFNMGWLQRRMSKKLVKEQPAWELWEMGPDHKAHRLEIPPVEGAWPTRVPGL